MWSLTKGSSYLDNITQGFRKSLQMINWLLDFKLLRSIRMTFGVQTICSNQMSPLADLQKWWYFQTFNPMVEIRWLGLFKDILRKRFQVNEAMKVNKKIIMWEDRLILCSCVARKPCIVRKNMFCVKMKSFWSSEATVNGVYLLCKLQGCLEWVL